MMYKLTCACEPSRPDWFDAGCPFHGLGSLIGRWELDEAYREANKFRLALMPGSRKRTNMKWGDG